MHHRLRHPASPLVRLLRNPAAPLEHIVHALHAALLSLLHMLPFLAGALALACALLLFARRRAHRRGSAGRLLEIALPPAGEGQGALLLWGALHDLLRPRLLRIVFGQPQLAFEIAAEDGRTRFRLWLPQEVPVALVERAVEAAWPGARCSEGAEAEPIEQAPALAASELSLSGRECFPLALPENGGPLRLLLGQLAGLESGERALVQIVAAPVTSAARARLRSAARRLQTGTPLSRTQRLLDLLPPGPPPVARGADPTLAPDVRAVLAK